MPRAHAVHFAPPKLMSQKGNYTWLDRLASDVAMAPDAEFQPEALGFESPTRQARLRLLAL